MDKPNEGPNPRIRLKEPKTELKRPEQSGSGLKFAAGAVVVVIVLLWFLRNWESSSPGSVAADRVQVLVQEPANGASESKPPESVKQIGEQQHSAKTLNGVKFNIDVPVGWKATTQKAQIIIRKDGDSRICQLGSDKSYDTAGLIAEVKGREADFEAEYVKQGISMGAPNAQVVVSGEPLMSYFGKSHLRYTVRVKALMAFAGKSVEQGGVNAVHAIESRMVRIQCMNMLGISDEGGDMERMGRSLEISNS